MSWRQCHPDNPWQSWCNNLNTLLLPLAWSMWLRHTLCLLLALCGNFTHITDGDGVTLSTAGIAVGVKPNNYALAEFRHIQHANIIFMPSKELTQPVWLEIPQEHDYPAAASYLSLTMAPRKVDTVIESLHKVSISHFKAKDIFRASGLSLLGISNSHVEKDRKKIARGTPLSPLLLVRSAELGKVIIADGYHRLCAVYSVNEDALIPCKIA